MSDEVELDLHSVIRPELIDWSIQATSKEQAISALCATLLDAGAITDLDAFRDDVFLRETEGPTNLENGVAIPHGKSESVAKTCIAIGRCADEIPWDSPDDPLVRIVFLFAVRLEDAAQEHLRMLQFVAICLADDDFIEALRKCPDAISVHNLFTDRINQGVQQ